MAQTITVEIQGVNNAAAAFQQVIDSIDRVESQQRRHSQTTVDANNRAVRSIDRIRTGYASLGATIRRVTVLAGLAFGGAGLIQAGRSALQYATQIETARDALEAFTGSTDEANRRLQRFRELSRLPGLSFQGISQAAINLEAVNLGFERSISLVTGLGNALALVGRTDLSPAVRAITQIISRGEVLQEELNQLVEATPITARALNVEFGSVLAENIREQLSGGVDEFITRLTNSLNNLPTANAEGAANTFQNFRIAVRELSGEIGRLALPALTREIRELTEFLQQNTENVLEQVSGAAKSFSDAVGTISQVIQNLLPNIERLFNLLGAGVLGGAIFRTSQGLEGMQRNLQAAGDGFGRFARVSGLLATGLARVTPFLSAIGIGLQVYAALDFVRIATGIDLVGESTERLGKITEVVNPEIEKSVRIYDALTNSLVTLTGADAERVERIDALSQKLIRLNRDLEALRNTQARTDEEAREIVEAYQFVESEIASTSRRLAELQDVTQTTTPAIESQEVAIRNYALELVNARESITSLREELNRISQSTDISGLANLSDTIQSLQQGLRGEAGIQTDQINQQIAAQRAILNSEESTAEQRASAQRQINELVADRTRIHFETERAITSLVTQELQLRLRLQNATQAQEITIQERAAQRVAAIYADRGRQAQVINQQNRDAILQSLDEEQAERQRVQIETFTIWANRILEYKRGLQEQLSAYTDYANRILGARQALADREARIDSEIQRQVDASRQTREERDVVDDFVSSGAVENTRNNLRQIYDANVETGQRLLALRQQQERDFAFLAAEGAVEVAFNRNRSFRDVAVEFLKQSARIILQNTIETNFILANNARLIASYQAVNAAKSGSDSVVNAAIQSPIGIPNINFGGLGNLLSGGGGALGIASLLFPQEFRNLANEISSSVTGAGRQAETTITNFIRLDDGTLRRAGEGQTRLTNTRRR